MMEITLILFENTKESLVNNNLQICLTDLFHSNVCVCVCPGYFVKGRSLD